ncbi:MAG: sigma factor [Pyrinomonadaceae bacterium]
MDAEDLLQDTFLRWQQTALTEIKSPKAFLSTVLKHLGIILSGS